MPDVQEGHATQMSSTSVVIRPDYAAKARRVVAARADSPAEARELLEMLGIAEGLR